jgi:hypothetical protein
VYIIGRKGCLREVKIGITTDLDRRRKTFQTAHSRTVEVKRFFAVGDPRKVEAAAHKRGKARGSHLRGEWFRLTPQEATKLVEDSIKQCKGVRKGPTKKKRRT